MATKKEQEKYFEGVGRRKRAIARVRIYPENKQKKFLINKKEMDDFISTNEMKIIMLAPMEATGNKGAFYVTAKVNGGGTKGQAEAIQLGLSRALVRFNGEFQKTLRDLDYLKRDPRKKERKKAGLKKARRAPQWSKR